MVIHHRGIGNNYSNVLVTLLIRLMSVQACLTPRPAVTVHPEPVMALKRLTVQDQVISVAALPTPQTVEGLVRVQKLVQVVNFVILQQILVKLAVLILPAVTAVIIVVEQITQRLNVMALF